MHLTEASKLSTTPWHCRRCASDAEDGIALDSRMCIAMQHSDADLGYLISERKDPKIYPGY